MWITILCILLDIAVTVGIVFGAVFLYRKWKQHKEDRARATERIQIRSRMVFTNGETVYTDAPAQGRPTVVAPLGIAPASSLSNRLPRESALDYGVVEPWDVDVDLEHEKIRDLPNKMWEQDLHHMINPY